MSPRPRRDFLPSILDRLVDPSLRLNMTAGYNQAQMVQSVSRDLESLLNTRLGHHDLPAEYKELSHSVLCYGLEDLTSREGVTPDQRAEIGDAIKQVIGRFEPRLRDVRVQIEQSEVDDPRRTLRFLVEACLAVDPAPDVEFETVLEVLSGRFSVRDKAA